MENQSSKNLQLKESSLEPLPDSDSEFWNHAEIHKELSWQTRTEAGKEVISTLKDHYFVRLPGHQAKCTHCDWGFQLDWGDKIVDGHLINKKGEFVI